MAASLFIAKTLGAEGQGVFEQLMIVPILLLPFSQFGLAHAAVSIHASGARADEVRRAVLVIAVPIAAATVLAGTAIISSTRPHTSLLVASAALVLVPATSISTVASAMGWMRGDAVSYEMTETAQIAARLLLFVAAWLVGRAAPIVYVSIVVSMVLLSATTLLLLEWRKRAADDGLPAGGGAVGQVFSVAWPTAVSGLLLSALLRLDVLMLATAPTVDDASIGRYAVATRLAEVLWILPVAMAQVYLVRAPHEGASPSGEQSLRRMIVGLGVAGLLVAAGTRFLLVPFLGRDYTGIDIVLLALLPGIVLYGLVPQARNRLILEQRSGRLVGAMVVAVGVNVVLNAALIPHLHERGAAIASSVAYALLAAMLVRDRSPDRSAVRGRLPVASSSRHGP